MGRKKIADVSDMSDEEMQVRGQAEDLVGEEYDDEYADQEEGQVQSNSGYDDTQPLEDPEGLEDQEQLADNDAVDSLNPESGPTKKKNPKPKKASVEDERLKHINECKDFMLKVAKCIDDDIQSNQSGKVALEKYKITSELCARLKKPTFSEFFLDLDGLNLLSRFIGRLPDGSWPLSNVRNQILKSIYTLPVQLYHMEQSSLGGVLTSLSKSPVELADNKKIIQMIKDKWSRIVHRIETEYVFLEECERMTNTLGKRNPQSGESQGKKKPTLDDYKTESRSYRSNHDEVPLQYLNPLRLGPGHNFCVRPASNLQVAPNLLAKEESFREVERFLSKIRTKAKKAF